MNPIYAVAIALLCSLSFVSAISSDSASIAEWTTSGRTLDGAEYYPGDMNLTRFGLLWNRTIDSSYDYASLPVVWEDRVFLISSASLVEAFNATTGGELWNTSLLDDATADVHAPALAGGILYVPDTNNNRVYALNATNGTVLWNYTLEGYFQNSLLVYNDTLIVDEGTNMSALYIVNGSVQWSTIMPGDGGDLVIGNATIITSRDNGDLIELDPTDGQILQQESLGSYAGTAVYAQGRVYLNTYASSGGKFPTTTYYVQSVNVQDFTDYETVISGGNSITPISTDGSILVTGEKNGFVSSLSIYNLSTTNLMWSQSYSAADTPVGTITDTHVIGITGHLLRLFERSTGTEVYRSSGSLFAGYTNVRPTVADGKVFDVPYSDKFYVFGPGAAPAISLNTSLNGTNVSSLVSLSCDLMDGQGLLNVTLRVWNSTGIYASNASNVSGTANSTSFMYTLPEGPYEYGCYATDTHLNALWSTANVSFGIDTTAPNITLISSTRTSSDATISWSTNELADSSVSYGTTHNFGNTSSSTALTQVHGIALTDLAASTAYYYTITSCDAVGNCNTSRTNTFTTAARSSPGSGKGELTIERIAPKDPPLSSSPKETVLSKNGVLRFSVKETHTVRIVEILKDSVVFEIRSDPVRVVVAKGEQKTVSLDGKTIVVSLLDIVEDTVKFSIALEEEEQELPPEDTLSPEADTRDSAIEDSFPAQPFATGAAEEHPTALPPMPAAPWIMLLLGVVAIVLVYGFMQRISKT